MFWTKKAWDSLDPSKETARYRENLSRQKYFFILKIHPFIQRGTEDEGVREGWRLFCMQCKVGWATTPSNSFDAFFIKNASENPVLWTGMKDVSAEGRKKHTRCWNKFSMTRRFGSGPAVIPNLFRDLDFRFRNLVFKAPPCGWGSLLQEVSGTLNQPIRLPGLKPGVCSGLILSGAFYPDLKIGVWRRRTYQSS